MKKLYSLQEIGEIVSRVNSEFGTNLYVRGCRTGENKKELEGEDFEKTDYFILFINQNKSHRFDTMLRCDKQDNNFFVCGESNNLYIKLRNYYTNYLKTKRAERCEKEEVKDCKESLKYLKDDNEVAVFYCKLYTKSEKAAYLKFGKGCNHWLPLSQIRFTDSDRKIIIMPKWLSEKNHLGGYSKEYALSVVNSKN